jgi:anti-sigma B factor antagonist
MEVPTNEGLMGAAADDRVAGVADQGPVRADLAGQAGTRVELAPAPFGVRRVDHPLGVVLSLAGELDLAAAPVLQEQLDRAVRGGGVVVVDLSGLPFIDSSGLHMLVGAERQLRASGGQLVLVRGQRAVHRVFELTGLDRYFAWCDFPPAALRAAGLRDPSGPRPIPKTHRRPTDDGGC